MKRRNPFLGKHWHRNQSDDANMFVFVCMRAERRKIIIVRCKISAAAYFGECIESSTSLTTRVERYGEVRSVLLYAEIRAVTSLKWPVIRPYYVTIRSSYTATFWHTAVENRIATVHGRITTYFNDSTARISAYHNTERMRTRIRPVLFVLGRQKKVMKIFLVSNQDIDQSWDWVAVRENRWLSVLLILSIEQCHPAHGYRSDYC